MNDTFKDYLLLRGARVLVLGADAQEPVDGVRLLCNHRRARGAAESLSAWLCSHGAHVTYLAPKAHRLKERLPGATLLDTPAARAEDYLNTLTALKGDFDIAFQLARVPSLRACTPVRQKIKIASPSFKLAVEPNIELLAALAARAPTFGYDLTQALKYLGPATPQSASWFTCLQHLTVDPPLEPPTEDVGGLPDLSGYHAIVTSGPTEEPVSVFGDALSNYSSGRQGHAVALMLSRAGAKVSLVSGPASVVSAAHRNIETHYVQSAQEMLFTVHHLLPADIFVGVAAVADFSPEALLREPLKEPCELKLGRNPDILKSVAACRPRPRVVVGFAAETHAVEEYARGKLLAKGADLIVANCVGEAKAHMSSLLNQVKVVSAEGTRDYPLESKHHVAVRVVREIHRRLKTSYGRPFLLA